jgi:hypothetical protein
MSNDLIFYQFSRSKVERADFSHFLGLYAPEKLPTGRRLRDMMNQFVFCVEGWDNDDREIHGIPEVRRFYSAFHQAWPYWLYFCNLDVDTLRAMTMCCMDSLTAIKVDASPQVQVQCEPTELLHFLSRDFVYMNEMCDRAQMFEHLVAERSKAVFQYFDLPYDAPASGHSH